MRHIDGYLLKGFRADFSGAALRGSDLRQSNLILTNFRESDLSEADLRGARLNHALMTGTCLRDAYLTGASLTGAKIVKVDSRGARGAKQLQTPDFPAQTLERQDPPDSVSLMAVCNACGRPVGVNGACGCS